MLYKQLKFNLSIPEIVKYFTLDSTKTNNHLP